MKTNIIFLIVAALIVAAGAYWYFFSSAGTDAPLTATTAQSDSQAQFQTLVTELQPISFTTTIFSDPRWTSLIDLATPVTPEPSGRTDPFAPIPGVSAQ